MELDWSTFALQVFNFLVLVWLLKRFLYKPVFEVIAERKARIDRERTEAEAVRAAGEELRRRYEERLSQWAREKERAREELLKELHAERVKLEAALQASLAQEREKAVVREEHRRQEWMRHIEETALTQAAEFAARLFDGLATPELHERIVAMAVAQLDQLTDSRRKELRDAAAGMGARGHVTSAYPLTDAQRSRLVDSMRTLLGRSIECDWDEDSRLVSGVRVTVGPWVFAANIRDELKAFAEAPYGVRRTMAV